MCWRVVRARGWGGTRRLLELAGKPLILHAVMKLRRVCMDVNVLSEQSCSGRLCAAGEGCASGLRAVGGDGGGVAPLAV